MLHLTTSQIIDGNHIVTVESNVYELTKNPIGIPNGKVNHHIVFINQYDCRNSLSHRHINISLLVENELLEFLETIINNW